MSAISEVEVSQPNGVSPLRRKISAIVLTVNRASPARALRYSMEPPTAEELQKRNSDATTDPIDDMSMTAGAPGGGGAGFGGPGGPPGGGFGAPDRPVQDPLVSALDRNSDGELSEEELDNAATTLLTADTNGDGMLTGDEIRPTQTSGSPVRRRPPMDDEEEAAPDQPTTEGGDEDPNSEAVKTDEAKTSDTSEDANNDDTNN